MKKIFTLLLLFAGSFSWAQQYNNEWIKHNQTYYKFQVGKTGLYRISKAQLDNMGIGGTSVQYFELWRNGQRVRLYSPVTSGPLASGGYLEFWGEINDGVPDKPLYRDPAFQHSTKYSIISDTAAYFLTVNPAPSTSFYTEVPNNVAANTLPVEPYFMHSAGNYYRNRINAGFASVITGEYLYSSSYDKGEFWTSSDIRPGSPLTHGLSNLHVDISAPVSTLSISATGNAMNTRRVRVNINGTDITDTVMDYFTDLNASIPIPTSLISSNNATVMVLNGSSTGADRMSLSYYLITYPRKFNFDNQQNFTFELPEKSQGYYLEISNFNFGSSAPVLYNLSSGERYVGDISTPGIVKFALHGSTATHKFVLVNTESANITNVNALTAKNFVNYANVANQGKYLIVTHPALYVGTHGNNPIDEYKNYRASAAGGSHNAKVADINELVDQFAFGIKKNPLSIKNFLRYARDQWVEDPGYVFLVGRGMTYSDYRMNEHLADAEKLNLVPSFGNPASDNMLSSNDGAGHVAVTPVGRLSVINSRELEDYLEKVKEYEYVQQNSPNTLADKAWMKNIVHVTGSTDPFLGTILCNYMGTYKQIIEDTLFGAKVHTFCKTSTAAVENVSNDKLQQLFAEGISVLTYFGHSSSTSLEFNLDNPQVYNNQGKYPVFFVNGCQAGNFFTYQPLRLLYTETLSEKFVLAKQRGTVAFVASTHFGIVNYLNLFVTELYKLMGSADYGGSLGALNRDALQKMLSASAPLDYYARTHAEEVTLHGDPALKLNAHPKPDYIIEEQLILINPAFVSIAENKFKLDVKIKNIGKASPDSIIVEIKRQYPEGGTEIIYRGKIRGIPYEESITLEVPIIATRDKGLNKIIVTLDPDLSVDEVSESNNTSTKEFFIYEDEARPAYPYNYAIINNNTQKLYASTANAFSQPMGYAFEMDTTELFNSSVKVAKTLQSAGGILEFAPGIIYQDSVVYYWRVSVIPPPGGVYRWNNSSFMYQSNTTGWNQSHYFQHTRDAYSRIILDSSRQFEFDTVKNHLIVKSALFPYGSNSSNYNGEFFFEGGCGSYLNSFEFLVFDLKTSRFIRNINVDASNGLYGSMPPYCAANGINKPMLFDFYYNHPVYRKRAMDFLDSIPKNTLVVLLNYGSQTFASNPQFIDTWQSDTALYGPNQSIYHKLKGIGLNKIDSFYRNIPFMFFFRKNMDGTFTVLKQSVGIGPIDLLDDAIDFVSRADSGSVVSTIVGPSKNWKSLHWAGSYNESDPKDSIHVSLFGIRADNSESLIYHSTDIKKDTAIDFISSAEYPFLRLKIGSYDTVNLTPYQLKYWRIKYDEMAEGALDPKLHLSFKDTVDVGEPLQVGIAFKNISNANFDSLKYKLIVTDQNNVQEVIMPQKRKPLLKGDTLIFAYNIDTRKIIGKNTLFLDINPDNDQPEQYHFNNFLYKSLYVRGDLKQPLLDVTFDGIHILNRDIVSAKPHIQIKLKDEAKFLLLNDTALSTVQIRYPDGNLRTYYFNNDTLRFTPAQSGSDNTATIDFYPFFPEQSDPEGDEYELIVKGKDRSDNKAGEAEYRVTFKVISKPMISNLLNYPNPFSTSTAFVFTLTGSEIPQNLKIQILTVTGKIVREITKEELGPIRIGRNITEFKWNGTDQYGQKLGNGVYLYRVVTTLNGKGMEKYKAKGDNTDKYFQNGYGKMYLMR